MSSFFERIQQLLRTGKVPEIASSAPTVHLDDEGVKRLMEMLSLTRDDEVSCAEVFAALDEYAEEIIAHKDSEELMPLVRHHLRMCVDCHDHLDMLLDALGGDETGEQTPAS